MRSAFAILLISFALLSCIEGAFVFDRRLLNSTNTRRKLGRDFTGSIRYGSFSYLGACPTGSASALPLIQLAKPATSGDETCFTDLSSGAAESIGYICQPTSGGSGIIHFGYPGTDGFVIGGAFFAGELTADTISGDQFSWGRVGAPSYAGEESDSCTASCTANYCTTTCSDSCTATATATNPTCSSDTTSGAGTVFFVPSGNVASISNCGTTGSCCSGASTGNFYSFCQNENIFTDDSIFTQTSTGGYTATYGIKFTAATGGIIAAAIYTPDFNVDTPRDVKIWDVSASSVIASGTSPTGVAGSKLTTVFPSGVAVTSGQQYIVSVNLIPADAGKYTTGAIPGNGRNLNFVEAVYSLNTNIPSTNFPQIANLDVIFNPCT